MQNACFLKSSGKRRTVKDSNHTTLRQNILSANNCDFIYNKSKHYNVLVVYYLLTNQNHRIMSKGSIYDNGWIDLVFEGRNQKYGAYQLRKQDPKTTILALITGIGLVMALIAIPVTINYFKPAEVVVAEKEKLETEIIFHDVTTPAPPKAEPVAPKGGKTSPNTQPTVKFTAPVVVSTTPDDEPPIIDDLEDANPGTVTSPGTGEGIDLGDYSPSLSSGSGTGTGDGPDTVHLDTGVDVSPAFPGGLDKFYKKVGKEFNPPRSEKSMTLKVYVSFVIEKDGTLSNIKVARDPGYGMAEEAIRVLKAIKTKWKPGIKNGNPVRTAYNLPITVNLK